MTSLRIFISSPGDVAREREIASRVIKRLQTQFYERAWLEPYFWEYEPMLAGKDYQANIPSTANFDIVICILGPALVPGCIVLTGNQMVESSNPARNMSWRLREKLI